VIDPKVRVQQASSPSKPARPVVAEPEVSARKGPVSDVAEHEVRIYAYELYERRGGTEDHAVEDWLTAEAHLAARRNRSNQTIAG
jgi:DUF2934 family protein